MSIQAEYLLLKMKCADLGIFNDLDLWLAAQALLDNGNYPTYV